MQDMDSWLLFCQMQLFDKSKQSTEPDEVQCTCANLLKEQEAETLLEKME